MEGVKNEEETANNIFLLTDQEKEHMDYLDKTYRDRAKERREAEAENIEEEFLNPDPNLFENDDGTAKTAIKKGLDFDLLRKEREKAEEEYKEKTSQVKPEVKIINVFSLNIK